MRSRLLATLLSVSLLFGSIPVNAAEIGAAVPDGIAVSAQTEAETDEQSENDEHSSVDADSPTDGTDETGSEDSAVGDSDISDEEPTDSGSDADQAEDDRSNDPDRAEGTDAAGEDNTDVDTDAADGDTDAADSDTDIGIGDVDTGSSDTDDADSSDDDVNGSPDADTISDETVTGMIMTAEQDLVIYDDPVIDENSISFDMECKSEYGYCYYWPTDNEEQVKRALLPKSRQVLTIKGLMPATEYTFQFVDNNGKVLNTIRLTTAFSMQAEYEASLSEDEKELTFKADVTGYRGDADVAYLNCSYTNALDEAVNEHIYMDISKIEPDSSGAKSFTISRTYSEGVFGFEMEAGTTYDIEMWVSIGSSGADAPSLPIQVKSVERKQFPISLHPENISFDIVVPPADKTVGPDGDWVDADPEKPAYDIRIDDACFASNESKRVGRLYYKVHGSRREYERIRDTKNNTTITFSRSENWQYRTIGNQIDTGTAYDFVLLIDGVKKELINKVVVSPTVKLEIVDEDEVNAFDFVRTYAVKSGDPDEPLTGSYTLSVYRLESGDYIYPLIRNAVDVVFNSENQYKAQVRTATLSNNKTNDNKLVPNTDYNLKWELKDESGAVVFTSCDTIHTGMPHIVLEKGEWDGSSSTQIYTVTMDEKDVANFNFDDGFDNFGGVYLEAYLKEKGTPYYYNPNYAGITLAARDKFSDTLRLRGIKSAVPYSLSLRYYYHMPTEEYKELASDEFTATAGVDSRSVKVTGVTPNLHSAVIDYAASGMSGQAASYVLCYIRPKDSAGSSWEKCGYQYINKSSEADEFDVLSYDGKELTKDTVYEYTVGIGDSYDASVSELVKSVTGEFRTLTDGRAISRYSVSPSYTGAVVNAVISGNSEHLLSYIHFFYKKKGDPEWSYAGYDVTAGESDSCSVKLDGLTAGTVYEYAIVISDLEECGSPDEVMSESGKVTDEFTTRTFDCKLELTDEEITYDSAVIKVRATVGDNSSRVRAVLSLNDGAEQQEQAVILKAVDGYTNTVRFTGLKAGTEYTVTGAAISIWETGEYVEIGSLDCGHKFKTAEAVIPKAIFFENDIPVEGIYLNALYKEDGRHEGYNCYTLRAKAEPAAASADFIWTSSNDTVAGVDNGIVYAAGGVGEADITVTSAYDKNISATCHVTVKKYAAGFTDRDGRLQISDDFDAEYRIYKNVYADAALYEYQADGSCSRLDDGNVNVTAADEAIASYEYSEEAGKNVVVGRRIGSTFLVFEKDGVKARLGLNVIAQSQGFGVVGFSTSDPAYPAVRGDDGSYTMAYTSGISYTAKAEASPSPELEEKNSDYQWKIDHTDVAQVDADGKITPLKAGDVTLTVTPKNHYNDSGAYGKETVEVKISFKGLPSSVVSPVYALANIETKIGDVKFPETWGEGWSWKYPDTPLVTNAVYTENSYPFEAVYRGNEYYPAETTLDVYIGRITGVTAYMDPAAYNNVLEAGQTASLYVRPVTQGKVSTEVYEAYVPDVKNLTVTSNKKPDADGIWSFDITGNVNGSYTLKPVIKAADSDKEFAFAKVKVKVVKSAQAASIEIKTDGTEGVQITHSGSDYEVIFDKADDKKNFGLKAVVKGRNSSDSELDTALIWKVTDKTVAAVNAVKGDSHSASVTMKENGHTVIEVKAKDETGVLAKINLEIRDHTPRVNKSSVNVNMAYDYNSVSGQSYAYNAGGALEIVPVYGEHIESVRLLDPDGDTSKTLKVEKYGDTYEYLVKPMFNELRPGTVNCTLSVKTDGADMPYTYTLKVGVRDAAPKVSVQMSTTPNLFFTTVKGQIAVKVSDKNVRIDPSSVTWISTGSGDNNGFGITYGGYDTGKKASYLTVSQQDGLRVDQKTGKLAEPDAAKGTLALKLAGYKKEFVFQNFTVQYKYKKPVLVTMNASSNIVTDAGIISNKFYVYDKTDKCNMGFYAGGNESYPYQFDEITSDCADIMLNDLGDGRSFRYTYQGKGEVKTVKLNLKLDSFTWREPLYAKHTVKNIKPSAYFAGSGKMIFNTAVKSTAYDRICIRNAGESLDSYARIEIKGANSKAQEIVDRDLFIITCDPDGNISVKQSDAAILDCPIDPGTYSYKVTPYYIASSGVAEPLNTLTLKLQVVNKPVAAKVSPKGNIDLTYQYNGGDPSADMKNLAVLLDGKFSNLADGYQMSGCRLVGEYSQYFTFKAGYIWYGKKYQYHHYIVPKDDLPRRLKAGQTYNLAVEYTFENDDNDTFTVKSNTFKVKTKQSAAKVTVINHNNILYAGAADTLSRTYILSVPSAYTVSDAYGSLDCNKDGVADIVVSGTSERVTVKINDKDAVTAAAKGKSYSIPVTVRLKGRDGIAQDVKTSIKVIIKR